MPPAAAPCFIPISQRPLAGPGLGPDQSEEWQCHPSKMVVLMSRPGSDSSIQACNTLAVASCLSTRTLAMGGVVSNTWLPAGVPGKG